MENLEPNIILGVIVLFGVLIILLIALLVTYLYVIQKSVNLKPMSLDTGKVSPDSLSTEVHAKSLKILEDAHKRANDILSEAGEFLKRDESKIALQVEKIGKVYLEAYESSLNSIKLEAIKTIQSIPKDINEAFSKSLDGFENDLKSEVAKNQEKISEASLASLKRSESEIEKHKAFRLKQIDDSLVSVISKIAKEVIARDLSGIEHEKLVLKALEEAKKTGIFKS